MEYLEPYEIFLRKAEADLNIIKLIQSARDYNIDYEIDYEIYMFHLQQATEKVIKALLCKEDITFHRTHDIESLFNLLEKKLKRQQRQVARKYENSKRKVGENRYQFSKTQNIIKLEKQIKLLHRRLSNIRNNHLHQVTNMIVKAKPSKIVMETLNIKGMMKNKHLSKAIAQQGLYRLKTYLQYKGELYGIELVEADKWYPSSKLCSCCGNKKEKLSLSERTYICEKCGTVIDRDLNAAINLSRYSA